jgi:hypothetical protein
MRPGSRRVTRALAALAAISLIAVGAAIIISLRHSSHAGRWLGASNPRPPITDPGPAHAERRAAPVPPSFTAFTPAQARAYAAAGMLSDGAISALPPMDDESRAELARMSEALASQHAIPGAGRPTHTSGGTLASASRQRSDLVAPAQSGGLPTPSDAPGSPASASGGTVQGARHLDLAQVGHGIVDRPDGPLLTGDDVWAMVRLDPARGYLRIVDQSQDGYVISLHGADFATIRLNGGLVVPGRYYQVQGTAEITGSTATAVHIRPLTAVSASYATPLLPAGNG